MRFIGDDDDVRQRSMITVALLAALGRDRELARHIEGALNLGITPDEIIEIMIHVAHYAGWPAGHNGQRVAQDVFALRDPVLHEFESEYQRLFKRVYDEANKDPANRGLEEFYPMPNIARRVLESFLSFRYPEQAGQLEQQVRRVSFDATKKARILRFLHTCSPDGKITEPEHDLSILTETPNVLKDLLDMVKAEDPKHYEEMLKLVPPTSMT